MTIKLKQRILLQAIDIHRHLTNEIKIQFLENSIRIKSVDLAHYEMVITDIPKHACEEYDLREDKLEIGIDLQKLRDFLRLFKKDDVLTFDYDPDTNRLIGKQGYLTRGMGLLDTAGWNSEKTPKVELKNMVSVDTKTFYDSLKGVIVNKNYEETYITTTRDKLVLENYDEDEDEDKKRKSVIAPGVQDIEIKYSDPGDFTRDSFKAHAMSVMNTIVNEGFFADVVVVVEGQSEVCTLWKLQETLKKNWSQCGIVVVPAGGKNNIDRPVVIFRGLSIPTYFIFDADSQLVGKGKKEKDAKNRNS